VIPINLLEHYRQVAFPAAKLGWRQQINGKYKHGTKALN